MTKWKFCDLLWVEYSLILLLAHPAVRVLELMQSVDAQVPEHSMREAGVPPLSVRIYRPLALGCGFWCGEESVCVQGGAAVVGRVFYFSHLL